MDRLFEVRPVRKAHETIYKEDLLRNEEFRQNADDAGLSVAKEKLYQVERSGSIGSI